MVSKQNGNISQTKTCILGYSPGSDSDHTTKIWVWSPPVLHGGYPLLLRDGLNAEDIFHYITVDMTNRVSQQLQGRFSATT